MELIGLSSRSWLGFSIEHFYFPSQPFAGLLSIAS